MEGRQIEVVRNVGGLHHPKKTSKEKRNIGVYDPSEGKERRGAQAHTTTKEGGGVEGRTASSQFRKEKIRSGGYTSGRWEVKKSKGGAAADVSKTPEKTPNPETFCFL